MTKFKRYQRPVPVGSIVVRIVEADGEPFGFVREVGDEDEERAYPTEQKPIDQVWRLVDNKLVANPGATVFIEREAGVEWRQEWGELEG